MQRLIQDTIRKALADELLFGKLVDGGILTVDVDDEGKVVLNIQPLPKKEGKAKPETEEASTS
jgi:ATP-dependent Clp protease ATP-binding subunit ClpA